MSHRPLSLQRLTVLAFSMLLAGSICALAAAPPAVRAGRSAAAGSPAVGLAAAWHWLAGLWPSPVTQRSGPGGLFVDSNGSPASRGTLPGYATVKGDEGSIVDPNGHH